MPGAELFSQYPEHLAFSCDAAQAETLINFDQHIVTIHGREALLLAYHLHGQPLNPKTNKCFVVFQHNGIHPQAPLPVQELVARLCENSGTVS